MGKNKPVARIDTVIPSSGGAAIIETADDLAPPAIGAIPAPVALALTTALERSAVTPSALISATWGAPQLVQPQRYVIQWSESSSFPDGSTGGVEALAESATIAHLKTNTLYYVRVAAVYHAIQSDWSTAASITTENDTVPPGPVTSAAADFTTGDLVLTWVNPTSANYKDVRVRIYASNGGTLLREVYSTVGRFVWTAQMNYLDTGGSPDPSVYVVLTARSWTNVVSTDVTVSPTKSAPTLSGSVTTSWDSDAGTAAADLVLSWTGIVNIKEYVVTLDGVDHITTDNRFNYPITTNRQEHAGTPDYAMSYSVTARDTLLQVSNALTGTATNAAPSNSNISVAITGFFSTLAVAMTITTPIQDIDYYSVKLYKDTILQSTSTYLAPNPVLSLSGSGTYKVGVIATDLFGRSSSEVQSSDAVIDSLTIAQLRADTEYTDDVGTSPTTLNAVLKESDVSSQAYTTPAWHWTLAQRPLVDRVMQVSVITDATAGYIGVSLDGVTYSWFSGPGSVIGTRIILNAVASEALAQSNAVNLSLYTRIELPDITECRFVKLGHKKASANYNLYQFYPRRLVQSDDIEAETIKAINILAGSITADRLSVSQLSAIAADLGTITAGTITGGTIQTASSGARIVMSAAAHGGLIGYGSSDTYSVSAGTGTYQILWDKLSGKLYGGGGNAIIDDSGFSAISSSTGEWLTGGYKLIRATGLNYGIIQGVAGNYAAAMDVGVWDESTQTLAAYAEFSYVSSGSGLPTSDYRAILYAGSTTLRLRDTGIIDCDATTTNVTGGLNVGTATGAGTGEIFSSGKIWSDNSMRVRQSGSTRYRSDWSVTSASANLSAYDDTGAAYIPLNLEASGFNFTQGGLNLGSASSAASGELRASGALYPPRSSGGALFAIDCTNQGSTLTIANNATANPFSNSANFSGLLLLTDTNVTGSTGLFLIGSSSKFIGESAASANYSQSSGTAGKINVYLSSGVVVIENKNGSSITFNVMGIRTRTTA